MQPANRMQYADANRLQAARDFREPEESAFSSAAKPISANLRQIKIHNMVIFRLYIHHAQKEHCETIFGDTLRIHDRFHAA